MSEVIPFDRTPNHCKGCPVEEICESFDNDWTDKQKDEWAEKVQMNSRQCSEFA